MSVYICCCEEEYYKNNCSMECDLCVFEQSNKIDLELEEDEFMCPDCCATLPVSTFSICFNCDLQVG